jgi:hypothetical protein
VLIERIAANFSGRRLEHADKTGRHLVLSVVEGILRQPTIPRASSGYFDVIRSVYLK